MGLYDRDYMRETAEESENRSRSDRNERLRTSLLNWLIISGLIIGIGYPVAKRAWNWLTSNSVAEEGGQQALEKQIPVEFAETPSSDSKELVNLNLATSRELESLPRIGPVLAKRIIDNRPYNRVDELAKVHGLSARSLKEILPLVTVTEPR